MLAAAAILDCIFANSLDFKNDWLIKRTWFTALNKAEVKAGRVKGLWADTTLACKKKEQRKKEKKVESYEKDENLQKGLVSGP